MCHIFFYLFSLFYIKGTRPVSAINPNMLPKVAHTEIVKKREENHQKDMERERMEKENQRKIEEMESKLSQLSTALTSALQVNKLIMILYGRSSFSSFLIILLRI